jgi:hypothetical protein
VVVDSLKALDLKRPIREADMARTLQIVRLRPLAGMLVSLTNIRFQNNSLYYADRMSPRRIIFKFEV